MNIWVTSDLHFGHRKNFLYEPRGFSSIEEHDRAIVENWNSVVGQEDEVFILGDLMLNDDVSGLNNIARLDGQKYIIIGNHDTDRRLELYKSLPRTEIIGFGERFKYKKLNFYLSHYPTITSNWDIEKPLPQRVINLCGHSHTQDRWQDWDKSLIYHCELDAHNNFPVPLDKIAEEIKKRF